MTLGDIGQYIRPGRGGGFAVYTLASKMKMLTFVTNCASYCSGPSAVFFILASSNF
jgi:hypothetical protein